MKGELYNYQGQLLTQAEISRLEGINRATLADWYKKTGDMALAVAGAKKSLAQRNINYNGEILSLKAISQKENIKFESLKKFYEQTNDIYEAVRLTKEAQLKRNGSILYNGKMMSTSAIALETGIERHSLAKHYEQTNDIYEAIRLTKEAQLKHHGTIEYKGSIMTITAIAELEGIKKETLKEYYEIYGDIEKAVFITKESQLKRKQALLKGKKASYEELARELNISVIELAIMINSGVTIDSLSKRTKKGIKKENQIKYDEDSLYRYCLEHSYNYWIIIHLIKVYDKTPSEAINYYLENGQKIPTKWIYEKYGLLFKHLALNFGLDSNRIIKIMKDNNCDIEDAITKLVFVTNNGDFKKAEIDWLEELYKFVKDLSPKEYLEAKETFFITEREEKFLNRKKEIIEKIMRQLLLFEFTNILESWPINELLEMMEVYNITEEEKKSIVLDLYSPFKSMIIDPTEQYRERNTMIKNIITDTTISTEEVLSNNDLSDSEKEEILKKKEIMNKILPPRETNKTIF